MTEANASTMTHSTAVAQPGGCLSPRDLFLTPVLGIMLFQVPATSTQSVVKKLVKSSATGVERARSRAALEHRGLGITFGRRIPSMVRARYRSEADLALVRCSDLLREAGCGGVAPVVGLDETGLATRVPTDGRPDQRFRSQAPPFVALHWHARLNSTLQAGRASDRSETSRNPSTPEACSSALPETVTPRLCCECGAPLGGRGRGREPRARRDPGAPSEGRQATDGVRAGGARPAAGGVGRGTRRSTLRRTRSATPRRPGSTREPVTSTWCSGFSGTRRWRRHSGMRGAKRRRCDGRSALERSNHRSSIPTL
jgi:hypothetical protein